MSHVDNVILSFSIAEDVVERAHGATDYPILDTINAWPGLSGQTFGPDLGEMYNAYGGSKALETPLFIGAFNYLPEQEFVAFLASLPWREPSCVQLIVKRQHGDRFEMIAPCGPRAMDRYRMAGWGDGGVSLLTMLQDAARDGYPVLWFAEAMSPDLFTHAIDGQIADIVASDAADEMRRQVREYIKATRAPST